MNKRKHYRTIFLSDIHLGTRGCQAGELASFLDAHHCDELYLVGDIIDGWRLRSGFYWPNEHSEIVQRLFAAARNGTRITYVTGNHDEFLRRYSDMELGNIRCVDQAVHRTADGRRLLVIHGDQYDVVTRYHRWLAFLGDLGYSLLLSINRHLDRVRRRFGYGYWSLSAYVKQRVKRAVNYIGEFEGALARHCAREGYQGVVCGHIHHAEIRDIGRIRYMNCGDWVESCTALVEDDQGVISVVRWGLQERPATVVPYPVQEAA